MFPNHFNSNYQAGQADQAGYSQNDTNNYAITGARSASEGDPQRLMPYPSSQQAVGAAPAQHSFSQSVAHRSMGAPEGRGDYRASQSQALHGQNTQSLNPNAPEWHPTHLSSSSVRSLPSPPEDFIDYNELYPDGLGVSAFVFDNGILEFSIGAKQPTTPRGTQMFARMMNELGSNVVAIKGNWCNDDEGTSDNWKSFKKHLDNGVSPELAAAQTWTGKMAIRAGYTNIAIKELIDGRSVDVLFSMPENKWPPGQEVPEACKGNSSHVSVPFI